MVDGQGETPKDGTYTNRIEDKYIINIRDLDEILEIIEDHLKPSYVVPSDYCLVSSIYLDSKDMKLLQQDTDDLATRYKLRVRRYAPDGVWQDESFLEVKYRVNGLKKKARIRVDAYGVLTATGGQEIPDKMKELNKDLPAGMYDAAVSIINKVIKGGVSPVIKVSYKRLAYKGKNTRLTLDQNLKSEPYAQIKTYSPSDAVMAHLSQIGNKLEATSQGVLEIKHSTSDDAPDWVTDLANKFKQGEQGFSKYLWGLLQALE